MIITFSLITMNIIILNDKPIQNVTEGISELDVNWDIAAKILIVIVVSVTVVITCICLCVYVTFLKTQEIKMKKNRIMSRSVTGVTRVGKGRSLTNNRDGYSLTVPIQKANRDDEEEEGEEIVEMKGKRFPDWKNANPIFPIFTIDPELMHMVACEEFITTGQNTNSEQDVEEFKGDPDPLEPTN